MGMRKYRNDDKRTAKDVCKEMFRQLSHWLKNILSFHLKKDRKINVFAQIPHRYTIVLSHSAFKTIIKIHSTVFNSCFRDHFSAKELLSVVPIHTSFPNQTCMKLIAVAKRQSRAHADTPLHVNNFVRWTIQFRLTQ